MLRADVAESCKLRSHSLSRSRFLLLPTNLFRCFYINILCAAGFPPSLRFISFSYLNLIKCANCFRSFQMRPRRWGFWCGRARNALNLFIHIAVVVVVAAAGGADMLRFSAHDADADAYYCCAVGFAYRHTHTHTYMRNTHYSLCASCSLTQRVIESNTHVMSGSNFGVLAAAAAAAFNSIIIVICWHLIWFLNFN